MRRRRIYKAASRRAGPNDPGMSATIVTFYYELSSSNPRFYWYVKQCTDTDINGITIKPDVFTPRRIDVVENIICWFTFYVEFSKKNMFSIPKMDVSRNASQIQTWNNGALNRVAKKKIRNSPGCVVNLIIIYPNRVHIFKIAYTSLTSAFASTVPMLIIVWPIPLPQDHLNLFLNIRIRRLRRLCV